MHFPAPSKGASLRLAAVSLVSASALVIGNASGVFAALTATASNGAGQTASSGTLSLMLSPAAPSVGITGTIANMAPGDSDIRYADLTNDGTLAATLLKLQVTAIGDASLITDGISPATTKALQVTVKSCSVAWTAGTCSGTQATEIAAAPLSTLATASSFLINPTATPGKVMYLQVTTALPDQAEVTVDGVIPATTIQGKTATLVYTFSEAQRLPATTTN